MNTTCCDECGTETPIHRLDAKPAMTRWLRIVRLFVGQRRMLRYAADHGYAFEVLACPRCYGPGYDAGETP